ncbi:hypothetical protein ACJMK2_026231, partial [Sinanodonta woodiana]
IEPTKRHISLVILPLVTKCLIADQCLDLGEHGIESWLDKRYPDQLDLIACDEAHSVLE